MNRAEEKVSTDRITSLQNGRIKNVVKLAKRRTRDEQQRTVVEGVREVSRALACGVIPVEAFFCLEYLPDTPLAQSVVAQLKALNGQGVCPLFQVPPNVFERMAYRGESGGLLLVIPYQPHTLQQIPIRPTAFYALVEGSEKPGNLGAILRTADGAGVDGIFACAVEGQAATDLHNPNVIRASLGTLFHLPIAETSSSAAIEWLQANKVTIVAATPDAQRPYTDVDYSRPVALASGNEAYGLSALLMDAADVQVSIPMHGIADSLNLSASTALLLYEVVRQRRANCYPDKYRDD